MYLGIDIGTSSVKAVLLDESGAIVAQASAPLRVSRPQPGFSEQDAETGGAQRSALLRSAGCRAGPRCAPLV